MRRSRTIVGMVLLAAVACGCRDRSPTPVGRNDPLDRSGIVSSPVRMPVTTPAGFASERDYRAYLASTGNFPASSY